jgi:hypothetical protein
VDTITERVEAITGPVGPRSGLPRPFLARARSLGEASQPLSPARSRARNSGATPATRGRHPSAFRPPVPRRPRFSNPHGTA